MGGVGKQANKMQHQWGDWDGEHTDGGGAVVWYTIGMNTNTIVSIDPQLQIT